MVKKKKQQMNYQFGTALQSLETAVRAGYSMENAVRECRKDLQRIYGQENDLVREFLYMEAQMEVAKFLPSRSAPAAIWPESWNRPARCWGKRSG